jgi:hypothetical protein
MLHNCESANKLTRYDSNAMGPRQGCLALKNDGSTIAITMLNYPPNDTASHFAKPTSSANCQLSKNAVNPVIIYNDHNGTS